MVKIDIQYNHLIVNNRMLSPEKVSLLTMSERRAITNYILALQRISTTSHFITIIARKLNIYKSQ